jgi:hypothetical protein
VRRGGFRDSYAKAAQRKVRRHQANWVGRSASKSLIVRMRSVRAENIPAWLRVFEVSLLQA